MFTTICMEELQGCQSVNKLFDGLLIQKWVLIYNKKLCHVPMFTTICMEELLGCQCVNRLFDGLLIQKRVVIYKHKNKIK